MCKDFISGNTHERKWARRREAGIAIQSWGKSDYKWKRKEQKFGWKIPGLLRDQILSVGHEHSSSQSWHGEETLDSQERTVVFSHWLGAVHGRYGLWSNTEVALEQSLAPCSWRSTAACSWRSPRCIHMTATVSSWIRYYFSATPSWGMDDTHISV